MIKNLTIENFKCYHERQSFRLSRINILTGLNGRGKSTFLQAILALAQSISKDGISKLLLQGNLFSLGSFNDILNSDSHREEFCFFIETDDIVDNSLSFSFNKSGDNDYANISHLLVDDEDRVVDMGLATEDGKQIVSENGARIVVRSLGSTEDIVSLRNLRNLTYISADRIGPVNRSRWEAQPERPRLDVHGTNLLNVLNVIDDNRRAAIQSALQQILKGGRLSISRDADDVVLSLDSSDKGPLYKPTNVGFGYGYILSTLVALELAEPGSIFIIENPEAHLHPGAQASLMEYLLQVALKKNLQLFVETHSDHIINTCLVDINLSVINTDDVSLLFFSRSEKNAITVSKLDITSDGHIPDAPEDFFDQIDKSLKTLLGF